MSGFVVFGGMLLILLGTIVWAALRSEADSGAALDPAERRDAAIEALRDLELEYRTGKVPEEEYLELRRRLERRAVAARDELGGGACPGCGAALGPGEAFCSACGKPAGP